MRNLNLDGQNRDKSHLMIQRWFGQRWDCEGEELAVAVFVHNLLQNQREGDRKAMCFRERNIGYKQSGAF